MKVLLVSTLERGGPVEQMLQLAGGLRDRGVGVGALCGSDAVVARMRGVGVPARTLHLASGLDLAGARRLWPVMRGADVVHAQDRRAGLWMHLAPGLGAVARVYTVHGLPDPYLPPPLVVARPRPRDRFAYEVVDSGLARRADALILPSQALADVFIERLRYPTDRIVIVPNGVTAGPRPAKRGQEVGSVSLMEPVKDLGTFLQAAARLSGDRPGLRFLLAGDGSQRRTLEQRARDLGLQDVVEFPGFVEASEAMRRLAVLVMPSIFENAPMAVLEAMASGVPVVASRTGGIPELVGPHGALLVTPGDVTGFATAIGRLLDDNGLAQATISAAAARVASLYTAEANARATAAIYEQALARRREPSSVADEHEARVRPDGDAARI